MSRSYLSRRQVEWERASLEFQEQKHARNVAARETMPEQLRDICTDPGCPICTSLIRIFDADIAWSERDLIRWRRKVERLERELSRKRRVKRSVRRRRREDRQRERLLSL